MQPVLRKLPLLRRLNRPRLGLSQKVARVLSSITPSVTTYILQKL